MEEETAHVTGTVTKVTGIGTAPATATVGWKVKPIWDTQYHLLLLRFQVTSTLLLVLLILVTCYSTDTYQDIDTSLFTLGRIGLWYRYQDPQHVARR